MKKIGLIACDLDGTLLDVDHATIHPKNVEALTRASEAGIAITIATGRVWGLSASVAGQLSCLDYAICSNGASLRDVKHEKFLESAALTVAHSEALMELFQSYNLPLEVYVAGKNMSNHYTSSVLEGDILTTEFYHNFLNSTEIVEDLVVALKGIQVEKFHIFHIPPEVRDAVLEKIHAIGAFSLAHVFDQNLEVAPLGVTKQSALATLAQALGLEAAQVMAFGDSGNDLEMLSWVGESYAMENGSPLAKAAARHQAPPNGQGGLGQMVDAYLNTL